MVGYNNKILINNVDMKIGLKGYKQRCSLPKTFARDPKRIQ